MFNNASDSSYAKSSSIKCNLRGFDFSIYNDDLPQKICTCLDGMKSIFHEVSFGVPQGSVLGPILFLLYANDLPNVSNFKTTLFADDANLNMSHSSIQTLQLLVNQEINKVDEWLKNNKLTLNYKKSNYMIIGSNHSKTNKFKLKSNHNTISQTNNVKYLGVFLDNQLSWQPHIDQTIKKLSRACGMIFKLRYYVPLSTLKLIYYSMFHSVIQYSLLNWGRASKSQLHIIKILQNRFLRASLFHDSRTSINVLYNEFRVLKLEDMIDMEFVKFVFKFSNNMLPRYFNNHFRSLETIYDHNTCQKAKKRFFPYICSN